MLIGIIIAAIVGIGLGIAVFFYERNKTRKNLGYTLTHESLRTSVTKENYSNGPKFNEPNYYRSGGYVPPTQTSDDTSFLTTALVASAVLDSSPSPSYDSCSSYDSGDSCGSD